MRKNILYVCCDYSCLHDTMERMVIYDDARIHQNQHVVVMHTKRIFYTVVNQMEDWVKHSEFDSIEWCLAAFNNAEPEYKEEIETRIRENAT